MDIGFFGYVCFIKFLNKKSYIYVKYYFSEDLFIKINLFDFVLSIFSL